MKCPECGSHDIKCDEHNECFPYTCNNCLLSWGDTKDVLCPKCGSTDMYVGVVFNLRYMCKNCGYWLRGEYDPDDKDAKGGYMGAYFNINGVILGESTELAVKSLGGELIDTKNTVYRMPNGLTCYFFDKKEVDMISFEEDAPIPDFYSSIGIHRGITKEEFRDIFESRGFSVTDYSILKAKKYSHEYQKTISVEMIYNSDGPEMLCFYITIDTID